jgi:uracil-DNA glycosylase family 4
VGQFTVLDVLQKYQMTDCCCALGDGCVTPRIEGRGTGSVLIVGQNPGGREDIAGEVFVGRSGQLLSEMLADAGWQPEEYRLTNAVRCHTPGDRVPTNAEIDACRPLLKEEIHAFKPKAIIALGAVALRSLTKRGGLNELRGTSIPLHPSFEMGSALDNLYGLYIIQRTWRVCLQHGRPLFPISDEYLTV